MRQDRIDALAGQAFALLMSALRPVVHPGTAGRRGGGSALLPPTRLDLRLRQARRVLTAELRLGLGSADGEPRALSWALPLPAGAAVEALELYRGGGGREPAGLCDRREARSWFDLARRTGLPSALLAEDAPGVYGLEIALPGSGTLEAVLRWRVDVDADDEGELRARCEAAAAPPAPLRRTGLVRLGYGGCLARLAGIVEAAAGGEPQSSGAAQAALADDVAGTRMPGGVRRGARSDVYAGSDRADGAHMMYRGVLAGRQARLWGELELRPAEALAASVRSTAAALAIGQLMDEYRCADGSEAARGALAARVARLGLDAGLATLWTSFVAIASVRDPGGESAFAAA